MRSDEEKTPQELPVRCRTDGRSAPLLGVPSTRVVPGQEDPQRDNSDSQW